MTSSGTAARTGLRVQELAQVLARLWARSGMRVLGQMKKVTPAPGKKTEFNKLKLTKRNNARQPEKHLRKDSDARN